MGWTSRLRQGIAKIVSPTTQHDIRREWSPVNSLNVNELKMTLEESIMGGTPPGFSQPVWGPEISTVGRYSQEGYTSKTADRPVIPFNTMAVALATDEDVSLAINHLASQVTGGEHYWKGIDDEIVEYMEEFTKQINFDEMDTKIVKELLWYGNSFWKPRMGIGAVRSKEDLMHIPISSAVRIWWDRQRIPYKYEFRGAEYQGYHNPDEIIHLMWNPVNASAFGVGLGVAMLSTHDFEQVTANGPQPNRLPSLLDRKYSNQLTMHITERRYTPRNVYVADSADDDEIATLRADTSDLRLGEDLVTKSSLKVQELGSSQRAFNPTQFTDTVLGPIMKALNDFRGKQGTESSHQFANAKTSAVLDQVGLSSFPLTVTRLLIDNLFKPWYDENPIYSTDYGGGMIAMPWDSCQYELNFGRVQKKDIDLTDQIKLIELAMSTGAVNDPVEIRSLIEDAGLGLRQEYGQQLSQQYNDYDAMPPDFSYPDDPMNPIPNNFDNQNMGSPPMDNPIYDSMAQQQQPENDAWQNNPFRPNPYSAQPSDPRLNFTEAKKKKR